MHSFDWQKKVHHNSKMAYKEINSLLILIIIRNKIMLE